VDAEFVIAFGVRETVFCISLNIGARDGASSIAAVTKAPTDTANVSHSVSATFVWAGTCRSHIGMPTAITRANVEAAL